MQQLTSWRKLCTKELSTPEPPTSLTAMGATRTCSMADIASNSCSVQSVMPYGLHVFAGMSLTICRSSA